MTKQVIIVGGGPAGLTAAYELSKNNIPCLVLEQSDTLGGIARTEKYCGYFFDMGGHRFFTKAEEINKIWHEALGQEFLIRSRLSRIYYRRKFFNYPLKPFNALFGLGLLESIRILLSYIKQRFLPYRQENNFEQWVSNRFGKRLYEIFFKSYTEKVWGLSCRRIGADWAAQRIKGLSLVSAVLNAFFGSRKGKIKTLISEFEYPKYGPGMMWEAMARVIKENGGEICLSARVTGLEIKDNQVTSLTINDQEKLTADHYINSMPLKDLIQKIADPLPEKTLSAANKLSYRAFLIVALIIEQKEVFPDNWIYIHEPAVKLGRIQNFKNWSSYMVPDQNKTCLGLEYFCDFGDEIWAADDEALKKLAAKELRQIGLIDDLTRVVDGTVLRVNNAYPVYDNSSTAACQEIKAYLEKISNLQTIGRAGMHRYNNMDHSMLTGLYAARNIIAGQKKYDLWQINADKEYHEIAKAS